MTVFFAAAHQGSDAVARALSPAVRLSHANDNVGHINGSRELRDALSFFAEHGLGSARNACEKAQEAALDGDDRETRYWLTVCRMFDRRLASDWACRLGVALSA